MSYCSTYFGDSMLHIVIGDIVDQEVDAVVNAANPTLLGGGGVDGAIHAAAGTGLLDECRAMPVYQGKRVPGYLRCDVGEAKFTGGYGLRARFVIHTVGPVWPPGDPDGFKEFLLGECYRNCLDVAKWAGLTSIAFPSISTGAYGFPTEIASKVALREIHNFLRENPEFEVTVVCYDVHTHKCYRDAFKLLVSVESPLPYNVEISN